MKQNRLSYLEEEAVEGRNKQKKKKAEQHTEDQNKVQLLSPHTHTKQSKVRVEWGVKLIS